MRPATVNLIRGSVVKRGVATLFVVKVNPATQAVVEFGTAVKRMQVEVVMFDGPPKPLDEDVVLASAAAVHADADVLVFEKLGKGRAGKLGALIGVEDLRPSVAPEGFLERLYTEI